MHRLKHGLFSLLSITSLILAAVGVIPAAAARLSAGGVQAPPPPFDRSILRPQRLNSDTVAPVDAALFHATGPAKIIVELKDDPAVVAYDAAQSSTGSKTQATGAAVSQLAMINQAQAE